MALILTGTLPESSSSCLFTYCDEAVYKQQIQKVRAETCELLPQEINSQGTLQSCAVGQLKNPVANLKLNAYLCWTCEAASCSREHRAVICAGESERQRYQPQGQEKTGMSQQSLSTEFSGFWIRSLANTVYLKGQQWKIWMFNISLFFLLFWFFY